MTYSAQLWQNLVVEGKKIETSQLVEAMQAELPQLVSAVFERTCNLSCAHCLYQDEKSSAAVSRKHEFDAVVENIVRQMPAESGTYRPHFLSIGRILRPHHLAQFAKLREMRPDVKLGVIDNGSYTKLLQKWPRDFKFDWIDISLDGLEEAHNTQRRSPNAFAMTLNGIKQARQVAERVVSLFTLTNLNYRDIEGVADLLLGGNEPLVDQFRVTFVSPTNSTNSALVVNQEELAVAWKAMQRISEKYGSGRIGEFGIYNIEDVERLAAVVGEAKLLDAFTVKDESEGESILIAEANVLITEIDGVAIQFLPLSIWPPEELPIEVDATQVNAYEGMFTTAERQSGYSKDGRDISTYTVQQLTPQSDFQTSFQQGVAHYWQHFGAKTLQKEQAIWKRIRSKV